MGRIAFLFIFASLFGCNWFGYEEENKPARTYWQSAGLIAPADKNKWGTGFKEIESIGNRMFVMNSRLNDLNTEARNHQIFTSVTGSNTWDTLEVPKGVRPFKMRAVSNELIVGTHWSGELWLYKPNSKEWVNLNFPKPPAGEFSGYSIYGIANYNGRLIVSAGGYDSATAIAPVYSLQEDSTWLDISPPYDPMPFDSANMVEPFYFLKAVEWRGKLFAITSYYGTWMYDGVEWRHIPNPPYPVWDKGAYWGGARKPRSIVVHKDRLYVGQYYFDGIHALQDNFNEWVAVDSSRMEYPNTDSVYAEGKIITITPMHVWSLASDGKNLFAAGNGHAIPMLYMGDKGEPKGWKIIDQGGWCPEGQFFCNGLTTYDMEAIGDTLYAVAWEGVYKFPLSKLDSAIIGQPSYE